MKYITMLDLENDEFDMTTADNMEDIKKLVAAGFQKIDEIQGIPSEDPKKIGKNLQLNIYAKRLNMLHSTFIRNIYNMLAGKAIALWV